MIGTTTQICIKIAYTRRRVIKRKFILLRVFLILKYKLQFMKKVTHFENHNEYPY